MRQVVFLGGFVLLSMTAACSSSDDSTGGSNDPVSEYAPGVADPCTGMNTDYLNDEICLAEPPEDVGVQVHYGPNPGTDYDDPDAIADFVIPADGTDYVQCQFRTLPNTEDKFISEYHTRARSGTHHVILWTSVTEDAARREDGSIAPECRGLPGHIFIPGAQSGLGESGARLDVPIDGKEAPENEGTARKLMKNAHVAIETHYINVSDKPMLAESWTNLIYRDPDEVKQIIDPIFLIGGFDTNVAYQEEQIVGVDNVPPPAGLDGELRIMGFAAHAHAHTTRVTAWVNRAGGGKDIIYETYDWSEPLAAMFDSQHTYPEPTMMGEKEAAYTGILTLSPGDTFGWECHIRNDDLPGVTLVWGDGAYEKEMCNIFGYYSPGDGGRQWNSF